MSGFDAAEYHARGFLHVPGVFAAVLPELSADADRLLETAKVDGWAGDWRAPSDRDATRLLTRVLQPKDSIAWDLALRDLTLLRGVGALLGTDAPVRAEAMLIAKPPEQGQPFPMHQDAAYYPHQDGRYVVVTVVLDAVTADNGGIRFLPGSQTRGLLPHVSDRKKYLPAERYRFEDTEVVAAQPGDVICASIYTVHTSAPNRSSQIRRNMRVGYRHPDNLRL